MADDQPLFNQVHLQAQAEREIPNDQLTVLLAVEKEGKLPASIADEINRTMAWALEILKSKPTIKARTLSYNTYPVYEKQTIISWRASQQLELESQDVPLLTDLLGKLQEKLQVKNMSFSASSRLRQQHENELIEEALQAFKQRVEIIKQHMEGNNVRIVNLHVNTDGHPPQPLYRERAMVSMDMKAAPAVEAGTSAMTVTVSGSVQFF